MWESRLKDIGINTWASSNAATEFCGHLRVYIGCTDNGPEEAGRAFNSPANSQQSALSILKASSMSVCHCLRSSFKIPELRLHSSGLTLPVATHSFGHARLIAQVAAAKFIEQKCNELPDA
eukprot:8275575-Alexandrium_andersonii.AAC.1